MTKIERDIVCYAMRYSISRFTGALSDVMDYYKSKKEYFEKWEVESFISDMNFQIKMFESSIVEDVFKTLIDNKTDELIGFRNSLKLDLKKLEDVDNE